MAITLSGNVSVSVALDLVNAVDLRSVTDPIRYGANFSFTNGTGANQANEAFADTRTLAASATEDLDLAGGLTDSHGTTLTFTKIKAIIIKAAATNTNNVQVTRPASNGLVAFMAAGDGVALTPGSCFALIAPDANGIAVTAGTGDLLTITNSAGTTGVTYDIVIVGTV